MKRVTRLSAAVIAGVALVSLAGAARAEAPVLDASWGDGGVVRTVISRDRDDSVYVAASALEGGRLIVAGWHGGGPPFLDVAVRYTARGRLDTTFGTGGIADERWGARGIVPNWQARRFLGMWLPSGKMLVEDPLERLDRDGRVDPTFGDHGRVTLVLHGCRHQLHPLLSLAGGKVLVVARTCDENADPGVWTLLRLLPDGRLDPTFGSGGITEVSVGVRAWGPGSGVWRAFALPDGRLVVAGSTAVAPLISGPASVTTQRYAFTVVRLDDRGTLDPTFGNGGIAQVEMTGEIYSAVRGDVVRTPAGRVLLAGCIFPRLTAVVGFRDDGTPDPGWGTNGVAIPTRGFECGKLALRPDGEVFFLATRKLVLLRADGTLDMRFGVGGAIHTRTGDLMRLEPGRRVVVAGGVDLPGQHRGVAVFRYRY